MVHLYLLTLTKLRCADFLQGIDNIIKEYNLDQK